MDHYDSETAARFLKERPATTVLCPRSVWEKVRKLGGGHNYILFSPGTTVTEGAFRLTALKAEHSDPFAIGVKEFSQAMDCVGAVREAVGKDVDLLIEGHGRFDIPTSVSIAKELEQFKPLWFEEPVPPDNLDALKALKDRSPVAISAGERLYSRYDYRPLFDKMCCDYIQPDISHAGGISELKKIAAEAESRYLGFAPHNPSGPVANASTLQLAAACPNFTILEIMYSDVEWRKEVTNESLCYEDGYLHIPDKPGLGIEISEEECLKHPYQPHTLRHYTGALTNIRPAKSEYYF